MEHNIQLKLPSAKEVMNVTAVNTLIDPDQPGSVNQIGSDD